MLQFVIQQVTRLVTTRFPGHGDGNPYELAYDHRLRTRNTFVMGRRFCLLLIPTLLLSAQSVPAQTAEDLVQALIQQFEEQHTHWEAAWEVEQVTTTSQELHDESLNALLDRIDQLDKAPGGNPVARENLTTAFGAVMAMPPVHTETIQVECKFSTPSMWRIKYWPIHVPKHRDIIANGLGQACDIDHGQKRQKFQPSVHVALRDTLPLDIAATLAEDLPHLQARDIALTKEPGKICMSYLSRSIRLRCKVHFNMEPLVATTLEASPPDGTALIKRVNVVNDKETTVEYFGSDGAVFQKQVWKKKLSKAMEPSQAIDFTIPILDGFVAGFPNPSPDHRDEFIYIPTKELKGKGLLPSPP